MKVEEKIKEFEKKEQKRKLLCSFNDGYEAEERVRKYLEGLKSELLERKLEMKEMLKNFQKDMEEEKRY